MSKRFDTDVLILLDNGGEEEEEEDEEENDATPVADGVAAASGAAGYAYPGMLDSIER